MGSVHSYNTPSGKRYVARYRKPDGRQAGQRGFHTKREAEDFLASVTVSMNKNQYVDPSDTRATIHELGIDWLQNQAVVIKPSSLHPLESA